MDRVVFVTQQVDPAHPTLGAATGMIRALASRVEAVDVLALRAVDGVLPANCRVHVFGAPRRFERTTRFAAALLRTLSPRPRAVIAHMSPVYAVLAAPVCRPLRVPVVLWFTHWRASPMLRLGVRAATAVATAERTSFPLRSPKVMAIGHGIDVGELPCRQAPGATSPLRLLALGRTSAIKGLETAIAGTRIARARGVEAELEIRGASETPAEEAYRRTLDQLAGDGVRVEPPIPRTELGELFARTDLLVNATISGSLDKAVLEATASCVPAVASSPAFADLLPAELRFEPSDAGELADRIAAFAALDAGARRALAEELRRRVVARHSTSTWAERILALADGR